MKSETVAFLGKAHEFLVKGRNQLEILNYSDEAGRAAYLAGLHAAQALIFERTSKIIKRHRGVRNELRRLVSDEPRFDPELRAFLGRTYNLKAIADYETGPGSEVTVEQAQQAIETAKRFIACIEELLA
jgi:uncharacterized protein (UPF0332 family)